MKIARTIASETCIIMAVSILVLLPLLYSSSLCLSIDALQLSIHPNSSFHKNLYETILKEQIESYVPAQKSLHTRKTQTLDGYFDFCLDPNNEGISDAWASFSLSSKCHPSNLYRMPVPSAFNGITSNASVANYMGSFWYQTIVSSLSQDNQLDRFLQFESVNYAAAIWVQELDLDCQKVRACNFDAILVGGHIGGYLPFIMNISQIRSQRLRLTILVSNILDSDTIPSGQMIDMSHLVGHESFTFKPDFDFFHYSGTLGSINLIYLAPIHLSFVNQIHQQISDSLSFHLCLSQQPVVELEISVQLFETTNGTLLVSKMVKLMEKCLVMKFDEQIGLSRDFLPQWTLSDGNPNQLSSLVLASFQLKSNGSLLDHYELRVGLRGRVKLNSEIGLLVDGQKRQLQGFGSHQEELFSGRLMSRAAIMKDINLMKEMGANVLRTSHYPYSSAYLDALDENGILVIVECAAVGLNSFSLVKLALHKQLLLETMQLHHHHPSVVAWSVANEPRSELNSSMSYFQSLMVYARSELASFTIEAGRLMTAAIAQPAASDHLASQLDLVMVNQYFGWYNYAGLLETVRMATLNNMAAWHERHPDKLLLVSEFGAAALVGLHDDGHDTLFSEEYQRDLLIAHELVFDELFAKGSQYNFIGSMVWNLADFTTHNSIMRAGGNRKGIFTRDRKPKVAASALRFVYLNRINTDQEPSWKNELSGCALILKY